jgi:hypothetical protein
MDETKRKAYEKEFGGYADKCCSCCCSCCTCVSEKCVKFFMYGKSTLLGLAGLACILGGAMVGGGDWKENLSSSVEMEFSGDAFMSDVYSMIKLATLLTGAYFFISSILGCVTMCCKNACCSFFYIIFISVGIILTMIMALLLLGFSGISEETINEMCVDNFSGLPYGVGEEIEAAGFSF